MGIFVKQSVRTVFLFGIFACLVIMHVMTVKERVHSSKSKM